MSDPILLEVVNNALKGIAEQMSVTMVRSSYSTIVKEMKDCSSAIFDSKGRLLAEGANIPIHLNCLGPCLNTILTKYYSEYDLHPGDLIVTNHPYAGGESLGSHHTKDIIMVSPVFFMEHELIGYSVTMLHHRDVGGTYTGDSWTEEIFQEGFLIEPTKLFEKGEKNEAVWRLILSNTRVPRDMQGDLMAQVSACKIGCEGLINLMSKYGVLVIRGIIEELLDYSEKLTRIEIEKIPDGTYYHEERLLDDGYKGGPYLLKVAVTVKESDITFDFSGTDPQIKGPINSPLSATISAVYYTMRALTNPYLPTNGGCQRPITVIAPKGTLVNCSLPFGCFQRMVTDHIIVDLIMGALSDAIPEKIMADSCGCIYDFCSARNTTTHPGGDVGNFHYWGEIVPGGLGARPFKDGLSVMSCNVTNCPIPPIEAQEIESPVLFLERAIESDSSGAGKFRGGFAQRRKWQVLGYDAQFFHTSQKSVIPPQGFNGGKPGKSGKWIINEGTEREVILQQAMGDVIVLQYGDTVTCITPSGGGVGNPFDRDPDLVLQDVREGLISIENAKTDYGVIIQRDPLMVDYSETDRYRINRE